ncbi:MAG: nucleotidyl transferase AbiEii/AbiGii toxin family protein [Planctomycetes bacterium]|nr:nucleotidyl transferase AbiEii/AbiGii toxin family protein [Planctomycetota bacterium]
MIDRKEIMDFSREFVLTANVIEKDYVLGWVLAGISNHPELRKSWVFKGGTCLKKCYFETYRFSEDLDFTVVNSEQQNESFLINAFKEIADWVYEATGIQIPKDTIRFEVYTNPRGKISVQGRISYRGPLQPGGALPRIKLDLTDDEVLVLDPVNREVHHPYSDKPADGIQIQAYCFEELFSEKIRALAERLRPRDLYDVIHLHRHDSTKHRRDIIMSTLKNKCSFKCISVPTIDILENKIERAELETEWENMLGHQVPVLPPFEQFWREIPELFEWLHRGVVKPAPSVMSAMRYAVDTTWRPPAMAQAWHLSTPLEAIRFAAVNRLCVNLTYQGSRRLIEPYSLRRTRDGNLLLYAVKHNTREDRSYRVDRIQGTEITKVPFTPKYVIELTTSGPISAPPTTMRTGGIGSIRPQQIRSNVRIPKISASNYGAKYVFECSYCGKRFTRKTNNSNLSKHKDKHGYPCSGRTGFFVDTKY